MSMLEVEIIQAGERCWPELAGQYIEAQLVAIARLPKGTATGKSSVTLRIALPDGQTVLAQTTLALLENAIDAFLIADAEDRKRAYDEMLTKRAARRD